ncbi:hypothetical protein [Hymenobacter pini]|uniref:hypothetical protein n=1 Tax=Hymenobacter pini TaxID=2880879 RepID=UPI001CF4F737|nr:hypothetical protein [Hymenobacter pini]MCA8831784.1 hypothetical protein [Hymenobacter pini]
MRLPITVLLLWIGSFVGAAHAQQPAGKYQFMHVSLMYSRLYFSPAYQNREMVRVDEYLGESYRLFDGRKLGWEAMSRLLNELSADNWELVSMVSDNDKDGSRGAVYLLRRPVVAK